MSTLTCDIVTPTKKLASKECSMVVVPGIEGEMGFLEHHAPLVSTLADGSVRLFEGEGSTAQRFAIQGGYVQVNGEKVIVLADRAVAVEDIDANAVKERTSSITSAIEQAEGDDLKVKMLKKDLDWCQVQESAAQQQ
jgi:F-type H+-transporting ATPase subunit epsilon